MLHAVRLAVLATALSAAVALWELALHALGLSGAEVTPRELAAWLGRDAAWVWPVAFVAFALRSRRGSTAPVTGWSAATDLTRIAVQFTLLLIAVLWTRELLSAWALGDVSTATRDRFLCTTPSAGAGGPGEALSPLAMLGSSLEAALLLQPAVLAATLPLLLRAPRIRAEVVRLVTRRATRIAVAALALMLIAHASASGPAPIPTIADQCPAGMPQRSYDVSAITVSLTLNRFGDHVPKSYMYALNDAIPAIRAEEQRALPDRVSIGLQGDAIQPLVLRANLGECLVIRFTNTLTDGPATFSIDGLPRSARNSGGRVGFNPDSQAAPGQTVTYTYILPSEANAEHAYHAHDHGAHRQRLAHGLFASVVLEPAGSRWLDPRTGQPLTRTSWDAIIDVPTGPDFREFVLAYHEIGDEKFEDILDVNGERLPTVDDLGGTYRPASRALNYRSEPFRDRMKLRNDHSQGYGSYMFGDPPTPIPRSYLGEPTKTRLIHTGSEVFHVHHLHGGATRWRRNPLAQPDEFDTGLRKFPIQNPASIALDSQSIGPGNSFDLAHECGAGGCQQAAGDFLFHCHIQHHYLSGMWSFWRVFDTRQEDLAVIPGRTPPPEAVPSTGLVGLTLEGKRAVPRAELTNPDTERALEDWIEQQLPPPGEPLDEDDATVWDWAKVATPDGPLYLGEPETTEVWANFRSPAPGQRLPILFNPLNGRYAWPLLRPHLAQRPPFTANGHSGAPWLGEEGSAQRPDGLCPVGDGDPATARTRRIYPISAIATPIPISRTRVDPDGVLYVLNEDKAAVLAGEKPKEPLVIRSNTGDCVDIVFTNEVPDNDLNEDESKSNLHTHFVQFDPQGSDGVISGFSFEQSVHPYKEENRTLSATAARGATRLEVTHVNRLRPGIWIGVGLGEGMCTAAPGAAPKACTEVRRIVSINGRTLNLDRPLEFEHAQGEHVGVEFVRYAWYSDVQSGTVFWHDHVTLGGWAHGFFGAHVIEPPGSTWHHPVTGAQLRSGAIADIHTPAGTVIGWNQTGSFREVVLALSDRGGGGRARETVVDGSVNLRAEPFEERVGESSSLLFSSVRHGDPVTPLLRAYLGDPVMIRGLGVMDSVGGLRVTGHRFKVERFSEVAETMDAMTLGVSERFDVLLEGGAGGTSRQSGDYLYYSTLGQTFEGGAWGLMRVHDRLRGDLRPLPGRIPPAPVEGVTGFPTLTTTGAVPPPAAGPGQPCPSTAKTRSYDLRISRADLQYHRQEVDSAGIVYSLKDASPPPKVATEPLVVRANAGECLELSLTNLLDVPASLNLGELAFDPKGSMGAAVGFNPDSSVVPGATRQYRFYADRELGLALMLNLADPLSGAHGAFGAVVVEPAGSRYRHPVTGAAAKSGIAVDVLAPGRNFREFVVLINDDDPRIGSNTMPYHDEVQNFTGMSYRADPFDRRDADETDTRNVFDSLLNGDPGLVFRAHTGDPLIVRVGVAWGEQPHAFDIQGHRWHLEPRLDATSESIFSAPLSPACAMDCDLYDFDGAGASAPGDYLFGDARMPFQEAGLWGILRVLPAQDPQLQPLTAPPPGGSKKVIVKAKGAK